MPYAILLAIPLALFYWKAPASRAARFAIVSGGITFLAMVVTRNAGTSIHHTVLLWPMPHLLVGAAFSSLPWRWLRVGLVSLLVASNLLVINQYIAQFNRMARRVVLRMPRIPRSHSFLVKRHHLFH